MTTGHVFIAVSLDGFIARKDHRIDWLMKQETGAEDHGYDEFIDRVDGIVMGRNSYEKVLTFGDWPYQKPVVVMSKSLSQSDISPELAEKVSITEFDPPELMKSLESKGWDRAYVDGGKVVQSFLRDGLIDDIVLTTIPILIGDGIRLFGETEADIDLELVSAKSFASGMVQSRYRVLGRASAKR